MGKRQKGWTILDIQENLNNSIKEITKIIEFDTVWYV